MHVGTYVITYVESACFWLCMCFVYPSSEAKFCGVFLAIEGDPYVRNSCGTQSAVLQLEEN